MKQISDALVIGSGIVGAAIAYALTQAGMRRVSLIEKGPLVSGMTRRNAGLAHPFHKHPLTVSLAQDSYPFYRQWTQHLGNSKSAFVETGAAVIASAESEVIQLDAQALMLAPASQSISILNADGLAALYPGIGTNFHSALYTPHAGYADAVQTAQAMVNAAKERGLQLYTGSQVKQINIERGQVRGAVTTTAEFETPNVIVAAGGWSERLLAPFGIALRLQFRRGVVLFYEQPRELVQGHPMMLDTRGSFFLRPHPYHMSAAGYVHSTPQSGGVDGLDEYVTPTEASDVLRFAAECIAGFADIAPKRSHSILYDSLADGLPALGRLRGMSGLFVAAGFGTSAFSVAPAVGATIAEMVIDGSVARDISSFDPLR